MQPACSQGSVSSDTNPSNASPSDLSLCGSREKWQYVIHCGFPHSLRPGCGRQEDDVGTDGVSVGPAAGTWRETRIDISWCRTNPVIPDIPFPWASRPSHPSNVRSPTFSSPLIRLFGCSFSLSTRWVKRRGGSKATPADVER